MAKQTVEEKAKEATTQAEHSPMLDVARKVLLAGMGAVALTQEEVEKFVNKLVERGQIAEKDGKKLVGDVMERRRRQAKKTGEELDKRVEEILGRMNVPSKADIEALAVKLAELTQKVDELKKA